MIIGIHEDGPECHSYSCGLNHTHPAQVPIDTTRMHAVAQAEADRLRGKVEEAERAGKLTRRPVVYTQEWFDSLTPEQQEEFQRVAVEAMARMGASFQAAAAVMQQLAVPFFKALADAFRPITEFIQEHQDELRAWDDTEPAGGDVENQPWSGHGN